MSMEGRAIALATEVHRDQVDRGGEPYILHALAVMNTAARSRQLDRDCVRAAAVLHDVLEDFRGSWVDRLRLQSDIRKDFGRDVYVALDALTHVRGVSYTEYIERVARNPLARRIKLADLYHNMDLRRIKRQLTSTDVDRFNKYRLAFERLLEMEAS